MAAGLDPNSIAGNVPRPQRTTAPVKPKQQQLAPQPLMTMTATLRGNPMAQHQHLQQPQLLQQPQTSRSGRILKPSRSLEAPGANGEPQSLHGMGMGMAMGMGRMGPAGAVGFMMHKTDIL